MPAQLRQLRRLWVLQLLFLVLMFVAAATTSLAQDTVEYAGAAASSASKTASISKALKPATALMPNATKPAPAATSGSGSSTFLTIPAGPPADVVNRSALEKKAGKNAAKMLLRSTPSGARVWVNGEFVGSTPLLLIVPPGKYRIRMADSRLDSAQQELGVLPHETRELTLPLAVRYPASVSIR